MWKLFNIPDVAGSKRWVNLAWVMMITTNGKGGGTLFLHDGSRIEVEEPPQGF